MTAANDDPPIHYVDDSQPGITRARAGQGWAYFSPRGRRIARRAEIDRLNAIALPPAYTDAWFCPSPAGHIQATGYDDKGRKQYRYHPAFRSAREAEKYERCADFGRALPRLRARVETDLASRRLDRDTVCAAVVRVLDLGRVRIGNAAYAKANKSFGATTLRDRHAEIRGATLKLDYVGKSGKSQLVTIEDRRLATIVKRCRDLPGQQLFQYLDANGHRQPIESADVNTYIRDATGTDFSAKHFRTWGASVLAYTHIVEVARSGAKLSVKAMLEPVAAALGNTPAISRKSYVHPALVEICAGGDCSAFVGRKPPRDTRWLSGYERGLIAFLEALAEATVESDAAPAEAA